MMMMMKRRTVSRVTMAVGHADRSSAESNPSACVSGRSDRDPTRRQADDHVLLHHQSQA